METGLVDPKEQYQADLLRDSLAYHSHHGGYANDGGNARREQNRALHAARAARPSGNQKRAA